MRQLKDLETNFHAQLGDSQLKKMRLAFKGARDKKEFADKGILWWILHNQLECVGRMEACKESLNNLMIVSGEHKGAFTGHLSTFNAKLDSLKQRLINLTGDLCNWSENPDHHTLDSFYVLDDLLIFQAMNQRNVKKCSHILTTEPVRLVNSEQLREKLNLFKESLHFLQVEENFISKSIQALDKMLDAADAYYAEISELNDAPPKAANLFYHFRKVQASGAYLLANVFLCETFSHSLYHLIEE